MSDAVRDDSPTQLAKKPRSRLVRILVRVAAVAAALVAVLLLVIIVPDQFSTTSQPPKMWLLPERNAVPLSGSDEGAATTDNAQRTESAVTASHADATEPAADAIEALKKSLRPFPDIAAVPADKRSEAETWNRKMDELARRLIALVESCRDMPYSDAQQEYTAFYKEASASLDDINRDIHRKRPRTPSEECSDFYLQWHEAYCRASGQLAADHEEWHDVAREYIALDLPGLEGRVPIDPTNWEYAKYYYMKDGWRGRLRVAAVGCMRSGFRGWTEVHQWFGQ